MNDTITRLVRSQDPDRFLTVLFAPPDRRDALLTLYAFDLELARARAVTSEPHLALIRLHWWREVVEGTRRRHEVATPLGDLLDAGLLKAERLLPVIDAYEVEAAPEIETLPEWRQWLFDGAGGIAVAAGEALGVPNPEALRRLGAACGVARLLRWYRTLAVRRRCLFPADLLADAGLSVHAAIDAPDAPGVLAVARRVADEGLALLGTERPKVSRSAVAAVLPAVLARRDLRRGPDANPGPRHLLDRLAVTWAGLTGIW